MKRLYSFLILINVLLTTQAMAATINLYGAGGPHPAIQKAAESFMNKPENSNIKINVTFGPLSTWEECAQGHGGDCKTGPADILWGTAEHVNVALMQRFEIQGFKSDNTKANYLRPAVILVQKGNPKKIQGINDLINNPKVDSIVVNNQGLDQVTSGTAIWEDLAGRLGKLSDIKTFRSKIILQAPGSGAAFKRFSGEDTGNIADAWISWPEWYFANQEKVDMVKIEPERSLYRDLNFTPRKDASEEALRFLNYLSHAPESIAIFKQYGFIQ